MVESGLCWWSLRRFTYGDLVTTFTSSKWPSLNPFPASDYCCQLSDSSPESSLNHPIGSSDGRCVQRFSQSPSGDTLSSGPVLFVTATAELPQRVWLSPADRLYLKAFTPFPFSLWTAPCTGLAADYPLFHLIRFLPSSGRYTTCCILLFKRTAVLRALGLPRNLAMSHPLYHDKDTSLHFTGNSLEATFSPSYNKRAGT